MLVLCKCGFSLVSRLTPCSAVRAALNPIHWPTLKAVPRLVSPLGFKPCPDETLLVCGPMLFSYCCCVADAHRMLTCRHVDCLAWWIHGESNRQTTALTFELNSNYTNISIGGFTLRAFLDKPWSGTVGVVPPPPRYVPLFVLRRGSLGIFRS